MGVFFVLNDVGHFTVCNCIKNGKSEGKIVAFESNKQNYKTEKINLKCGQKMYRREKKLEFLLLHNPRVNFSIGTVLCISA